jgi:hypothetical protein
MIQITINAVDLTDDIVPASLQVVSVLTNEPDSAQFQLKIIGSRAAPVFDDDIVIYDGSEKIFAGKVVEVSQAMAGSKLPVVLVRCVDHTFEFDRLLASKTYESQTIQAIIADLVSSYATGFTSVNANSTFVIEKIVFNQVPLSQCIRRLADIVRYDWYIDEDKAVHFFEKNTNTAPFDLTDTNGNYVTNSLVRSSDGSQLVNRVKVRGGLYDGNSYTDVITATGSPKSFVLPYKMSNLVIELNTVGTAFATQGVGIDFIDEFGTASGTTISVLYNFQMQSIRFENELTTGNKVRFTGNPKVAVLAVAEDSASVALYGVIEKIIKDTGISSNEVARQRATAELVAFAETVVDASFMTYTSGLRTGMLINVASSFRGFDDDLLIKKLTFRARTNTTYEYQVDCISTQRYSMIDLLRKIITPDPRLEDEQETAEQIYPINEEVVSTDLWTNVSPELVEETVTSTDTWLNIAGNTIVWVYGFYFPTSHSDTNRMGRFDRDSKYQ